MKFAIYFDKFALALARFVIDLLKRFAQIYRSLLTVIEKFRSSRFILHMPLLWTRRKGILFLKTNFNAFLMISWLNGRQRDVRVLFNTFIWPWSSREDNSLTIFSDPRQQSQISSSTRQIMSYANESCQLRDRCQFQGVLIMEERNWKNTAVESSDYHNVSQLIHK